MTWLDVACVVCSTGVVLTGVSAALFLALARYVSDGAAVALLLVTVASAWSCAAEDRVCELASEARDCEQP